MAVEMDEPGWSEWDSEGHQVWHEGRIRELLATEHDGVIFVSGCAENQGAFYSAFSHIILLRAPEETIRERLANRTNNPYGKRPDELARVMHDLETVEPLLRQRATHEIDATRPVSEVVGIILSVVNPRGTSRRTR
jgi:shikimate kinase